jgi:uncharacterized protein (TIGR03545 family)
MATNEKEVKKKKQGPIRTEALIPLSVFGGLCFAYGSFFLDDHLKWGMEAGLGKLNGAQVDISSLELGFVDGNIRVHNLQFTNPERPQFNRLVIDQMNFRWNWDALLRAKFVIEESSLGSFTLGDSARKQIGKVNPPEESKGFGPGGKEQKSELQKEADQYIEKKYEDNVLNEIWKFIGSQDVDQGLENIEQRLNAKEKIANLRQDYDRQSANWNSEVQRLKKVEKTKSLIAQAKSLKLSNKPKEALKQLKQIKSWYNESKTELSELKQKSGQLAKDIKNFNQQINQVDDWIKADIAAMKEYLNIPDLKLDDLSINFAKAYILKRVSPYIAYYKKIEPYLPKSSEEDDLQAVARAKGRDYRFPVQWGYPVFWLKKMSIGVEKAGEKTGLSGRLEHISSNVNISKKDFYAELRGQDEASGIKALEWKGTLNPKVRPYQVLYKGSLNGPKVKDIELTNSDKAKINLADSGLKNKFDGVLAENGMSLNLKTFFEQTKWKVDTNSKKVAQVAGAVFSGINRFSITTQIKGKIEDPKLNLKTDLGRLLEKGLKREIKQRLEQAQKRVKDKVSGLLNSEKARILGPVVKNQSNLLKGIDRGNLNLNSLGQQFDKIKRDFEKKYKGKAKSKAKDLLKDFKNKLKL